MSQLRSISLAISDSSRAVAEGYVTRSPRPAWPRRCHPRATSEPVKKSSQRGAAEALARWLLDPALSSRLAVSAFHSWRGLCPRLLLPPGGGPEGGRSPPPG